MDSTIADLIEASGEQVGDNELVNFGRRSRLEIKPSTGPRSYWSRYGDIKHLTLPQLQAVGIGQLAAAGRSRGADVIRISALPPERFTARGTTSMLDIGEYTIDVPVPVRVSISLVEQGQQP